jgi:hypothetical protein
MASLGVLLVQQLRDVHIHKPRTGGEARAHRNLNAATGKLDLAWLYARPMPPGVAAEALDKVVHRPRLKVFCTVAGTMVGGQPIHPSLPVKKKGPGRVLFILGIAGYRFGKSRMMLTLRFSCCPSTLVL